jgi:hypothetical protein
MQEVYRFRFDECSMRRVPHGAAFSEPQALSGMLLLC